MRSVAASATFTIPDHVARFRAKTLRNLVAEKNEAFRSAMLGHEIDVLTLEDGSGISSNFVRVGLPAGAPINQWLRVVVTGLHGTDGVQANER